MSTPVNNAKVLGTLRKVVTLKVFIVLADKTVINETSN